MPHPLRRSLGPAVVLRVALLLGLSLLLVPAAAAQLAVVEGRVVDAADGAALPGANVLLRSEDGGSMGVAADGDGRFAFVRLTPGTYVVTASFVGYEEASDSLTVAFGETAAVTLTLAAASAAMHEVVVETERTDADRRTGAGLTTIAPAALARVPMPGITPDLAGYLLTRPGVVSAGDRGGGLFIRGGTPTQNLVLIDGMPLYQPFHIVGFYSAVPADIVSYADVYAGGFGARYGGRLSSVIDVQTRSGSKQRAGGAASVAPFLSTLRVEVPFVPGKVSVLASVRESVIERVAPRLLGEALPYRFGDRFFKMHAYLNATSSFSVTALRTFDAGDVADAAGQGNAIQWRNAAYGGRYTFIPSDRPVLFNVTLYTSALTSRYAPFGLAPRAADVESFGGEATYLYLSRVLELEGGLFGRTYSFQYDLGLGDSVGESVTEGGGYVEARVTAGAFRIEPGLRVHSFPSRSGVALEPRLRAAWSRGGHTLSAAAGRYHQEIVGLYNLRDVTDAFVAWAPSPAMRPVPRAHHLIAGWKGPLGRGVTASAEAYEKRLANTVTTLYDDATGLAPGTAAADGAARGLDVSIEVTRHALYAYAGYGLATVWYERETPRGRVRFHPPHDRRHNLNLLGRYTLGPWALGLRWQYGSGRPFTQMYGFYDTVPVDRPTEAFHTRPGRTVLYPAGLYDARLPSYHRLDATAERRFTFDRVAVVLQAALINAYDRSNLFDYDLFTGRRTDQLPLIPSLGLLVEVR